MAAEESVKQRAPGPIVGYPESGKSEPVKTPDCASNPGTRCVKSYCLVLIVSGAELFVLT
jgi:hypothetical protein